jgi:cystathionine beta-lyase family protein involved in aluminum resistance
MGVGVGRDVAVEVGIELVAVGRIVSVGGTVVVGGTVEVGKRGWFEQPVIKRMSRRANVRTAKETGGFLKAIR